MENESNQISYLTKNASYIITTMKIKDLAEQPLFVIEVITITTTTNCNVPTIWEICILFLDTAQDIHILLT